MTGWTRRLSLTHRLIALAAVAVAPALAALIYLIASIHQERLREAHDQAQRLGELASLEMERIVGGVQGTLYAVARSEGVRRFEAPGCDSYLAEVVAALPQLGAILAADRAGRVRCSSAPQADLASLADLPAFDGALASGDFVVGTYTVSELASGEAFLPLAAPIVENGAPVGVIVGALDLDWLGARVRDRNFAAGGALTVADREGIILAREPFPERFVGASIPEEFMPLVRADAAGTIELTSQDGVRRVTGYFPPQVTAARLYVSAGLSTEAALAPVYASTLRSLALALVGTAAAFVLAYLLGARLLRRPIRRLLETVAAWRRGEVAVRTGIRPNGAELTALAAAIDGFMDELVADRAARREAESHRDLLFSEMQHRIKNILATVQALANQTLRGAAAPEALKAFEGRLAAMAETHQLLLSQSWGSADARATLEAALRPFGAPADDRLRLVGPRVRIIARAAVALSMVAYELGTNAAKYGALSAASGSVEVSWSVRRGPDGERFTLTWIERGGPPVGAPGSAGFGTRLMRAAFASEFGATSEIGFEPTGVSFRLDADAGRVLDRAEPEDAAA